MFESFFPRPKLFFASAAIWALAAVLLWFLVIDELGGKLSLGGMFGLGLPEALPEGADEAAVAAYEAARVFPMDFWSHQYMIVAYALFAGFWLWFAPSKWANWSVAGSALIIFVVWFQVWIDVKINDWFGIFYDTIQKALAEPNSVSAPEFYGQLFTFAKYAGVAIVVALGFVIYGFVRLGTSLRRIQGKSSPGRLEIHGRRDRNAHSHRSRA